MTDDTVKSERNDRKRVRSAFENESKFLNVEEIVPLKTMRPGTKESHKYQQILSTTRAVGLVEQPVVIANPKQLGQYFLLDGHLRIEALKDLGISEVECLIATDDETYTYNKKINRIPPIQEHRMILRAIKRGVTEEMIAEALCLDVQTIKKRKRLLEGICEDAVNILKDSPCPAASFDILKRLTPMRQIEAAELMIGQKNFTVVFARAILASTPEDMLIDPLKKKRTGERAITTEQISRMERELASLQVQVKSVEDTYGIDNLHLTIAKGYIRKLIGNAGVVRWLSQHRQEYLSEFQSVAEIERIAPVSSAAE